MTAAAIRLAPTSLAAHAVAVHRTNTGAPLVPARHHLEWIRVLEDRERYPYVVVVASPGTGKSVWFSTVYPTFRIGQSGGQVRMGLLSNEYTLASGFAKTVQDAIVSRPFQLAYPGVTPDFKRGWRLDRFFVNGAPQGNNPTLAAAGVTGPIQGRRFDEIVMDDPTTQDDARSPTVMEQQRARVRGTILNRFPAGMRPPHGTGGRMVVVCTRWAEKDLVPMLTEDLGFKLIHMPALGYWDRYYECPSCHATAAPSEAICGCVEAPVLRFGTEPLWPEVEPLKQLLAERHDDELMFELVKQGNPKALSGDVFDAANFQRGRAPREFDMIAQYVDTAGGRDRRRGDYFAIVTMGRRGKDAWVLDVKRGRYAAPEQERMVIYAGIEWDPDVVAIEAKNEGVALYQRLVAMGSRLPLQLRDVTREKEFRAIPLASAYRAHLVYHAAQDSDGNPNKWVGSFESELEAFPGGGFDDQCFPAGTLVMTPEGPRAIDEVAAGARVLGASGWVEVEWAGQTGRQVVYDRFGLRATAGHPIWTERGWRPFLSAAQDDRLSVCDALLMAASERSKSKLPASACAATSGSGAWLVESSPCRIPSGALLRAASGADRSPVDGVGSTMGGGFATAIRTSFSQPSRAASRSMPSSSTGSPSGGIPTARARTIDATTAPLARLSNAGSKPSIERFGKPTTDQSQRDGTSTTRTATTQTTASGISAPSQKQRTGSSMPLHGPPTGDLPSSLRFSQRSARSLSLGTGLRKGAHGIGSTGVTSWRSESESELVFNLRTSDGTYFADGVLVHNCDAASGAYVELDRTSPRVKTLGPGM